MWVCSNVTARLRTSVHYVVILVKVNHNYRIFLLVPATKIDQQTYVATEVPEIGINLNSLLCTSSQLHESFHIILRYNQRRAIAYPTAYQLAPIYDE